MGKRGNKLVVLIDRVTDEQVRGVTERGEWAGDGKRVGWGRKESGLRTEGEWDGGRRCVGWGWDGGGLGEEGEGVGRMEVM